MAQALPKQVTFDEFIECLPERSKVRYELYDGVIVEMPKPTGKHSNVTGFLIEELVLTIIQMVKRGIWTIPRESIVKSTNEKSGYEPDIIVLDQDAISREPRWERESIIENATSVKLIVEVVSTNWRDDYHKKLAVTVNQLSGVSPEVITEPSHEVCRVLIELSDVTLPNTKMLPVPIESQPTKDIQHPEHSEIKRLFPEGSLTSTAPSRPIAGEGIAEVLFIRHQFCTTGINVPLTQINVVVCKPKAIAW